MSTIHSLVRQRNINRVAALGVPVNVQLPAIGASSVRTQEAVAGRCLAELAAYQLYLRAPPEPVRAWVSANGVEHHLAASEREMLARPRGGIARHERIDLSWWIESIYGLLWVLGLKHDLGPEVRVPDDLVRLTPNIERGEPAAPFFESVRLRSPDELAAMTDLFYVAHWSAREARLTGQSPGPLVEREIVERRRALDWSIDDTTDWDHIDQST